MHHVICKKCQNTRTPVIIKVDTNSAKYVKYSNEMKSTFDHDFETNCNCRIYAQLFGDGTDTFKTPTTIYQSQFNTDVFCTMYLLFKCWYIYKSFEWVMIKFSNKKCEYFAKSGKYSEYFAIVSRNLTHTIWIVLNLNDHEFTRRPRRYRYESIPVLHAQVDMSIIKLVTPHMSSSLHRAWSEPTCIFSWDHDTFHHHVTPLKCMWTIALNFSNIAKNALLFLVSYHTTCTCSATAGKLLGITFTLS